MPPARKRRKRTKRCWACYCFLELDAMHEICMPPLLEDGPEQESSDIYRRVCPWCAEQITRINHRFASRQEWQDYWQQNQHCQGLFKSRPQNHRQHPGRRKPALSPLCFFCGQPVGADDPLHRPYDIHHKIPRREFEDKVEANRAGNLSYAHRPGCHDRFNREYDRPDNHDRPFATIWAEKNLGQNIFADDTVVVA